MQEKSLQNLVINKVENQEVYDSLSANGAINSDELYLVGGDSSVDSVNGQTGDVNLDIPVVHKIESQDVYDEMVTAGQINAGELYLVQGDEYVQYTEQSLTDEQKAQARENIGAASDADVVQSDWNQNDENAKDYIKNRVGGYSKDPVSVILYTGVLADDTEDPFSYSLGQKLLVSIDGEEEVEYTATSDTYSNSTYYIVGSVQTFDEYEAATDAWQVYFNSNPNYLYSSVDAKGSYVGKTISIRTIVIEDMKIPAKYLDLEDLEGDVSTLKSKQIHNIFDGKRGSVDGVLRGSGANQYSSQGLYSVALGQASNASGDNSFAIGEGPTASGPSSQAFGWQTIASGSWSHAEGTHTKASGYATHAEGEGTTAASIYQHVQGSYNIPDEDSLYIHIVGNGNNLTSSNAHTIDKKGNGWFAGDVYVGSTSKTNKDDGSKKLATEDFVDTKIQTLNNLLISDGLTYVILKSSTENSTKKFKITVDDSGTISATEVN